MLRIERLSPDAQETLRVLAAGPPPGPRHPLRASGIDSRALRDALREAVAAQLVVTDEEGRYMFRHALLREVVVDDLLPGERADMHLALARALEHRAEGLPAHGGAHLAAGIAHHYLASGDQPKALVASVRAAEAAEAVHANGEAAALYSRALQLWDRVANAEELAGRDHISLLRAAAHTTGKEHEPARAESYLRAALHELGDSDPVRTADLLEHLARNQFNQGRSADAAETRRRALDLLPEEPSKVRATLLASVVKELMLESRHDEAVEAAQEAMAVARAVGDEVAELRALDGMGVSLFGLARYEEGEKALREALSRMPERGLVHYLYSHVNLADALFGAGRIAEAREVVEEGDKLAAEKGAPRRWLMMLRSELAFAAGDWAEAEAALPSPGRPAMGTTFINDALRRIELALGRGDHDEARRLLDEARDVAADTREPQWIGPLGSLRAELERRTGDLDAARAGDRRRPRPARLLLAGRRAHGPRGRHRRARRGRRRGTRPRSRRGPVVRDRLGRRADRPRRGVRRGRPPGRGRVPGHAPAPRRRARRATTIPTCGRPPSARGTRSGVRTAPRWRCAGRPRRSSRAATATRRPRARSKRSRQRSASAPRGSLRRSRASRCARGCGWSPTSLRRHPRYPPRMPAKTRSGSRRASARCWLCSPMGAPTGRSARRCTWRRRPRASTSRASSPSWTCAHGPRPRRWPTEWASSRRTGAVSRRSPSPFPSCPRRWRTAWR